MARTHPAHTYTERGLSSISPGNLSRRMKFNASLMDESLSLLFRDESRTVFTVLYILAGDVISCNYIYFPLLLREIRPVTLFSTKSRIVKARASNDSFFTSRIFLFFCFFFDSVCLLIGCFFFGSSSLAPHRRDYTIYSFYLVPRFYISSLLKREREPHTVGRTHRVCT